MQHIYARISLHKNKNLKVRCAFILNEYDDRSKLCDMACWIWYILYLTEWFSYTLHTLHVQQLYSRCPLILIYKYTTKPLISKLNDKVFSIFYSLQLLSHGKVIWFSQKSIQWKLDFILFQQVFAKCFYLKADSIHCVRRNVIPSFLIWM